MSSQPFYAIEWAFEDHVFLGSERYTEEGVKARRAKLITDGVRAEDITIEEMEITQ
jgi:hypothetical protein